MSDQTSSRQRPDYGIDAPGVLRNFIALGVGGVALGIVLYLAFRSTRPTLAVILLNLGIWPGLSWHASAGVMLWGSKVGKLRERDRLLESMAWRGDEMVLDVGCGHGLLLIGAAKRLTTGKAIGIDRWQSEDQSDNRAEATRENCRIEQVADRVDVRDGDARQLPFADNSFDVVVSSWALHNIYDRAGRQQALDEMVRVLKPGGHLAILDIQHTGEYAGQLRERGLSDVQRSTPRFLFLIPSYQVTARKPS